MTTPIRVLVVGFGPVAARFAEDLLPALESGAIELTIVGAEASDAYNRVLVAEYAVGHATLAGMEIADTVALRGAGARVRTGVAVRSIDRRARTATLSDESVEPWDRLVFATGARALIPPLGGLEQSRLMNDREREALLLRSNDQELADGVTALRDLADADAVRRAVRDRRRVIVLGAGVLGLEIALAAAREGADVCVVHTGGFPMGRNLDQGAGHVLTVAARAAGVSLIAHSRIEDVVYTHDEQGRAHFDALLSSDGKMIHGDLLILSCGVRARTELARSARLPVASGILVDRDLSSWGDADVFAIGDCAQVLAKPDELIDLENAPGAPSGLIGPGWRQAEWLAARLRAEVAGLPAPEPLPIESPSVVTLKAEGVDVVAAGDVSPEPWDVDPVTTGAPRRVAQWADPEHGRYVKLVTRDGVLEAMACVGMPRTAAELTLLYQRRGELPADRSVLLRHDGPDHVAAAASDDPAATVCWCNGVSAGRITEAAAQGHTTVESVGACTRAGTGCGGCKSRIGELLEAYLESSAEAGAEEVAV